MINKLRVIAVDELNEASDEILKGYLHGLGTNWGALPEHERPQYLPMVENIKTIQARRRWLSSRDAFIAHLSDPSTTDEALSSLLAEKVQYLDNVSMATFEYIGIEQLKMVEARVDASNVEEQRDLIEAEIQRRASSKQ